MGRSCTVCEDPDVRDEVDRALVGGESYRAVAHRFGLSRDAVRRHAIAHVSPSLAAVRAEREERGARSLMDRVEALVDRLERLAHRAEEGGKVNVLLASARELRETYRLIGKLTGELDDRPQQVVNLLVSPDWHRIRAAVYDALGPFPEARTAVSAALAALDGGSGPQRPPAIPARVVGDPDAEDPA